MDEAEEGIQRKGIILSALTRLKQVCNHPAQFLKDNSAVSAGQENLQGLPKCWIQSWKTGKKPLFSPQFAEMGKMLKEHLQASFGCEVLFLHGGVPRSRGTE
jgi:SNF2 family DNA or RNA helicase